MNIIFRPLRGVFALTAAALVAGCGFVLVGERPLPAVLQTVFVDVDAPYQVSEPPLQTALRTRLLRQGAAVVAKAEQASARVRLWDLAEGRETLSIGPDGKALEYRLIVSVRYELRGSDGVLVPADTLSVSRDYSFNPGQILAKEAEEAQLREFIQDEMAELLLLRLEAALSAQPPATPAPAR